MDELEVWQIAEALGARGPVDSTVSDLPSGDELIRQRVLAAQGLAPEPEAQADPALAGQLASLAGLMNG